MESVRPRRTIARDERRCIQMPLLNTLLHATVYVFTRFAECSGTDYKQNGITKRNEDTSNGGDKCPFRTGLSQHRASYLTNV
jgi:hypothetical protein